MVKTWQCRMMQSGTNPQTGLLRALRRRLNDAMAVDYPQLRRDLDRWRPDASDAAPRFEKLRQQIEASALIHDARRARLPQINVPEELPIAAKAAEISAAIRAHQLVVIAGETGSGKTTQLPKLCLAAGRGLTGLIGCTQPRRIAAKSIARRVAEELKSPLGALVGFAVRFQDQIADDALVKFMTDGILLAETQSDRFLRRYDTLIIDEAHERSLNIDFLLGYLKRLLPKRPDLKVIVTSATIDTDRFSRHFGHAPVISVEGRGFPVEVRWRPIEGDREERGDSGLYRSINAAVEELGAEDPRGDILVFLPGEREIRDAHKALEQRRYAHTEVLPLYARLSGAAQDRVFQPGAQRRIVLATNVAETSITVPRIRFVIDSGIARVNRYSQRAKVQRLQIEPISQASANQRAGRCGRLSAGIAVRLFDEADFQRRSLYTDPELLRSSLSGVILRMLDLDLGDPSDFPFLDPPSDRALVDGFLLLREIGATDADKRLTQIGRDMANRRAIGAFFDRRARRASAGRGADHCGGSVDSRSARTSTRSACLGRCRAPGVCARQERLSDVGATVVSLQPRTRRAHPKSAARLVPHAVSVLFAHARMARVTPPVVVDRARARLGARAASRGACGGWQGRIVSPFATAGDRAATC